MEPERDTVSKTTEDIRPLITTRDGTVLITIVNLNGGPSTAYRYSSRTGKLEKTGDLVPVEWIGGIHISPSILHRAWIQATNIFEEMRIPTKPRELAQFIRKRGKGKPFYRVKAGSKVGSIYLPNMLNMAKRVQSFPDKDRAFIAGVAVAPHRQGQGFGTMLHIIASSYLKVLGYTKMTSDIVGMNTDGEIAIWKGLAKQVRVVPFNDKSFSISRFLQGANVIDKTMAAIIEKTKTHINGELLTLKQITKREFKQFEMDLADERIPVFVKAESEEAKAA